MIRVYVLMTAITVICAASTASAADNAVSAAANTPTIQFGLPANTTLAQMRKLAHEKADALDKMTPEQWEKGQQEFHAQMEHLSTLSPD